MHNILNHKLLLESYYLDEEKRILCPIMMTKPPMPEAVIELVSCNCKTKCDTQRCTCYKGKLKCTLLCHKKASDDLPCTNKITRE